MGGAAESLKVRTATQPILALGGIGVLAVTGPSWAVVTALATVGLAVQLGLGVLLRKQGETEAKRVFRETRLQSREGHYLLVAQTLYTLNLLEYIKGELRGEIDLFEWKAVVRCYHREALKEHPDKVQAHGCTTAELDERRRTATEKFVAIQHAFDLLEGYHNNRLEHQWKELLKEAYQRT